FFEQIPVTGPRSPPDFGPPAEAPVAACMRDRIASTNCNEADTSPRKSPSALITCRWRRGSRTHCAMHIRHQVAGAGVSREGTGLETTTALPSGTVTFLFTDIE